MTHTTETKTLTLSKPLKFGDQVIDKLTLRRPAAGDLRGIKLRNLIDMDVDTVVMVLPRVSLTPLPANLLNALDPADLLQACVDLSGFFEASTTPSPTTP